MSVKFLFFFSFFFFLRLMGNPIFLVVYVFIETVKQPRERLGDTAEKVLTQHRYIQLHYNITAIKSHSLCSCIIEKITR